MCRYELIHEIHVSMKFFDDGLMPSCQDQVLFHNVVPITVCNTCGYSSYSSLYISVFGLAFLLESMLVKIRLEPCLFLNQNIIFRSRVSTNKNIYNGLQPPLQCSFLPFYNFKFKITKLARCSIKVSKCYVLCFINRFNQNRLSNKI